MNTKTTLKIDGEAGQVLTAELVKSTPQTWAAYNDQAVWGAGATPEAARKDAIEWLDRETAEDVAAGLSVAVMTPEMARQVATGGSAMLFGLMPDGRLGSKEEWEDEHAPEA